MPNTFETLRRRWWELEVGATAADAKNQPLDDDNITRAEVLLDQLIASAKAAGAADVLSTHNEGMIRARDIRVQHIDILREQLLGILADAAIDNSLVHASTCPMGSGCDCGASQAQIDQINDLLRQGHVFVKLHDSRELAEDTHRVLRVARGAHHS